MKIYPTVGALLVFVPAMLLPARSRADGPDSYGIGARNAALGSAMAAGSDDWASAYYNPAGIAVTRKIQAGFGFAAGIDHLQSFHDVVLGYDDSGNVIRGDVGSDYENVYGIVGGLAIPLTRRLSFGLTVWSPAQRLVRIMTVDDFIPHYGMYVNRAQRITFNLAMAYRITPALRMGLGGSSLAKSNFNSNINIPGGTGSDPNDSRGLIALDILPTLVPTGGVEYDAGHDVTVGATYRGEADLKVHVQQISGADVVFPVGPSLQFRSSVEFSGGFLIFDHYTPQQLAIGAKWDRPGKPVALFGDVTYMNWAAYHGPYIDPNFNDIAVPPLGTVPVNWRHPEKPGFRDTYVPRVGAEWRIGDAFALRGGYSYEMTPAPLATGEANLLDANTHVVSAGAGIKVTDPTHYVKNPVTVNLHARLRQLESTTAVKKVQYDCNDPSQKPPVGYPCAGKITAAGQILSGGLDLDFEF
jgi:long-subunit fatty acid transport protein